MSKCPLQDKASAKAAEAEVYQSISKAMDNPEAEFKKAGIELAQALSRSGDREWEEIKRGDAGSLADIDLITQKLTGYKEIEDSHGKRKYGYKSFDEIINSDDETRLAYFTALKEAIYHVTENTVDPTIHDSFKEIFKSGIGLAIFNAATRHIKVDRNIADFIPIINRLNKIFHWEDNPVNSLQHLDWANLTFYKLETLKQYSQNQMETLNEQIKGLMRKASSVPIFKKYGLARPKIGEMMSMFDGMDYDEQSKQIIKEKLTTNYEIEAEDTDMMYNALLTAVKGWNIINYGIPELSKNELQNIAKNPRTGTVTGYIQGMRKELDSFYQYVLKVAPSLIDTPQLRAVDRFMDATQINFRKHYLPTIADQQLKVSAMELEDMFKDSDVTLSLPALYRQRNGDSGENGIDFEMVAIGNNVAVKMAYNRAMQVLSKVFLDHQHDRAVETGFYTGARADALDSVDYLSKKLGRLIHYDNKNMTPGAKLLKNGLSVFSLYVSGILGAPKSAINNLLGGRLSAIARLGLEYDLGNYQKKGGSTATPFEKAIWTAVEQAKSKYMSPGMASEFQAIPEDVVEGFNMWMRKAADWVGDGGIMGWSSWWKKNLTVKGTENHMREYIAPMIFDRVAEKLKLQGINEGSPDFNDKISELVEIEGVRAWTEITNALGHFDPLNKPLWAHLQFETAETAPQVMAGFALKAFYTFRHVFTTVTQNLVHSTANWRMEDRVYNTKSMTTPGLPGAMLRAAPAGASIALLTIAMVDMFREWITPDEEEQKLGVWGNARNFIGSTHVNALDAVNPLEGATDVMKFLAFSTGAMNVDKETYQRYKQQALRYSLGMLGGREIRTLTEEDRPALNAITNIFSMKTDWNKIFSDDIIETGVSGENLYEMRRNFKEDLGWLRATAPGEAAAFMLLDIGTAGGFLNKIDNPDIAKKYVHNILGKWIMRMTGLSIWNEQTNDEFKKRYVSRSTYNRQIRPARYERLGAAAAFIDPDFIGNDVIYQSYMRRYSGKGYSPKAKMIYQPKQYPPQRPPFMKKR